MVMVIMVVMVMVPLMERTLVLITTLRLTLNLTLAYRVLYDQDTSVSERFLQLTTQAYNGISVSGV